MNFNKDNINLKIENAYLTETPVLFAHFTYPQLSEPAHLCFANEHERRRTGLDAKIVIHDGLGHIIRRREFIRNGI